MRICNRMPVLIFFLGLAFVGGIPRLGVFLRRGVVFACLLEKY